MPPNKPYLEEQLEIAFCIEDGESLDELIDCFLGIVSNLQNAKHTGFKLAGAGSRSIMLVREV